MHANGTLQHTSLEENVNASEELTDTEFLSEPPEIDLGGLFNMTLADIDVGESEYQPRFSPVSMDSPIVAIDTEYTYCTETNSNKVLCYSYAVGVSEDKFTTGIIYPKTGSKEDRIENDVLVMTALQKALDDKIIRKWPDGVFEVGHFIRADIANTKNFSLVAKGVMQAIRKTIVSSEPYGIDLDKHLSKAGRRNVVTLNCKSNRKRELSVEIRDTMLVAPAGKSLKDVGESMGVPKMEIPPPYSIERMDIFLAEQPALFEAYAINDAVISLLHMIKYIGFCAELGLTQVPHTIGSLAVSSFKHTIDSKINDLFGSENYSKTVWNVSQTTSSSYSRPVTLRGTVPNPYRALHEDLAIRCYHGGRNECYWTGPTELGIWNDFDLKSCYTAASAAIKPIDYANYRKSQNPSDFCGDFPSFALVNFEFPEGTRFPSMPVRTENNGLCYPLQGRTYCTGSEIEVALAQGASIEILIGVIFDWAENSKPIFVDFMAVVRNKRNAKVKGGFEEKLWKEIGNSLYGKMAQGLVGKTAFDVQKGISSKVPCSLITNPYFAAHITGFARAVLSEILARLPDDKIVVSATTDGFLTNATLDEVDLSGSLCQRFLEKLKLIDPNSTCILELKHAARQIIAMKTRGAVTAERLEGASPVTAKANVQVPRHIQDANDYMVDLYLHRQVGQTFESSRLTSTREQLLTECDMVNIVSNQRLNLEPDFKRELIEPRLISVKGIEHIALASKPHQDVTYFLCSRRAADVWRQTGTLKTLSDWDHLSDRIDLEQAKRHADSAHFRIKEGETSGTFLLRMFFRVFTRNELGLRARMSARLLAEFLGDAGFDVKASNISASKKAKLVLGAVPVNSLSIGMLAIILKIVGPFRYHELFAARKRHLIDDMLAAARRSK